MLQRQLSGQGKTMGIGRKQQTFQSDIGEIYVIEKELVNWKYRSQN